MSHILSKHSSSAKTKKTELNLSIEERLAKLEADKKQLLKEMREQKKLKAKRALDEMRLNRISWEKELCVALRDFFPDTPSELAKLLRRAEDEIHMSPKESNVSDLSKAGNVDSNNVSDLSKAGNVASGNSVSDPSEAGNVEPANNTKNGESL